jgi:HPt (histidine-containing phosphotransfer) domain-containing protein
MDTAIDISQDTLSSSFQADSRLTEVATRGSRRHEIEWSMTPELLDLVECDPGMIADLFSLFLDDSAARLQVLGQACDGGDFRIVRGQAHSLKGSALQIGAPVLGFLCAALELSNEPEPEMRRSMMRAINEEFILVRRAIERYLAVQGN